jgi:chemotaxis signal transduction protein
MGEHESISLLKFKIADIGCALDAYLVEEMVNISHEETAYSLFDLAERLGMDSANRNYRKAIVLRPVFQEKQRVGILAEEIEEIEEFSKEALRKLPWLIAKTIKSPLLIGFLISDERLYLLIDGEVLANMVS